LGPGSATITSNTGSGAGVATALAFGTLTRAPGATVNFAAGSGTKDIGDAANKISFTGSLPGQATVTNGNILPYGVVTTLSGVANFATNLGGGSIGSFTGYITNIESSTSPLDVVRQQKADSATVTAAGKTIAALVLQPGATGT